MWFLTVMGRSSSQVREGEACIQVNENVNVLGEKSRYFCPTADAGRKQMEPNPATL